MVLNDCKKRYTNLGMTWIDCKKAYNMISHSWILEIIALVQVFKNIFLFIRKLMTNWNTKLISCGKYLTKVGIRRDIFRETVCPHCYLWPIWSPWCRYLMQILRKVELEYTFKNEEKLKHFLFMDGLKIFAKSEREVNGLASTMQMFSDDTGMEFGIKKMWCTRSEEKKTSVIWRSRDGWWCKD